MRPKLVRVEFSYWCSFVKCCEQVQGNIFQIFTKFLENGKVTIRLKEPPHDLFISKVGCRHALGVSGIQRDGVVRNPEGWGSETRRVR